MQVIVVLLSTCKQSIASLLVGKTVIDFFSFFRDYDSLSKENVFENNNLVSISWLCSCNSSYLSVVI